tara:strand:+ start:713 stop:889 length:177 start_codon:yes stop_codon:yes gene_type:complete
MKSNLSDLEIILNALNIVRIKINPGRNWSKWGARYKDIEEAYFNLQFAIQKIKENNNG